MYAIIYMYNFQLLINLSYNMSKNANYLKF